MPALNSTGTATPCEVIDNHSELINLSVKSVNITNNGQINLDLHSGGSTAVNFPYFSDFFINNPDITQGTATGDLNKVFYNNLTYQYNAQVYNITASGPINLTDGDLTYPRQDLIYVDVTGNTVNYLVGTAGITPVLPQPLGDFLKLSSVYVQPNANGTSGGFILDSDGLFLLPGSTFGQTMRWDGVNWAANSDILIGTGSTVLNKSALSNQNTLTQTLTQNDSYITNGTNYSNVIQTNTQFSVDFNNQGGIRINSTDILNDNIGVRYNLLDRTGIGTATYNIPSTGHFVIVDSNNTTTVNMPLLEDGKEIILKLVGTASVTINGTPSTIDGTASLTTTTESAIIFIAGSSEWKIISKY